MNLEILTASDTFAHFTAAVDALGPEYNTDPYVQNLRMGLRGVLLKAPPPQTLEKRKEVARAKVKALRDQFERAGVTTPYGVFDSDPDSQRKVTGAVLMAMIAMQNEQPFEIDWRLKDNSIVSLSATDMVTVGVLIGQHVEMCQQVKNSLDAAIELAESAEDLDAIDLNQGWPGA